MVKLKVVAEELLEKETIDAKRFEDLFTGKAFEKTEKISEE